MEWRGEKHETSEQWPFLLFHRAGVQREWAAGTQDSSINIKATLLDFFDLDLAGSGCPVPNTIFRVCLCAALTNPDRLDIQAVWSVRGY